MKTSHMLLACAATALGIAFVPVVNVLYAPILGLLMIITAIPNLQWADGLVLPTAAWVIMSLVIFIGLRLYTLLPAGKQWLHEVTR